ncbi:extracellular solute-binding protein [Streptomyces sp. NPDC052225]|uniref:vWA domain-containing protein n=1 Tax=Streptomyces sp. NPDC052225 TaxID=3154949 RepID=UPI003437D5B8
MKRALTLALVTAAVLTGCTTPGPGEPGPEGAARKPSSGNVLRILASSELSDMAPALDRTRDLTGIDVDPTYMGTLDAVQLLASGKADGKFDAVWLSSNDYLRLVPGAKKRIVSETPVMSSPVAIGVREEALGKLGRPPSDVTWKQFEQAVTERKLTYGMTDPARSHSGFATLVSVASALSGAQSALTGEDIGKARARLKEFFRGQQLTSGSSGFLAQAYVRRGDVDALLNYESVLAGIPGLTVIRPKDGVVTADYPLSSLAAAPAAARENVRRLAETLRTPELQQAVTSRTLRRPVVSGVTPAPGLDTARRRELPFPGTRSTADELLSSYENELRRPSRTVYVLDTSGSMKGERLAALKRALHGLTGGFREREEVTLMPFGNGVKSVRTHVVDPAAPRKGLDAVERDTAALTASGGTAVYTSLEAAYGQVGGGGRDMFTSIVLMTDGENTTGAKAADFDRFYRTLGRAERNTPVFPILFGDASRAELSGIAELTGGRLFDAVNGSLAGALEEIRGYQ